MCTFDASAVSVYSLGFWYWLVGPLLYFGVSLFGLVQLVLHCCRAEKVIRHYVAMLSLFLGSLLLRGFWFMFTCPSGAGTDPILNATTTPGGKLDAPVQDYDDALMALMGNSEYSSYGAGIKVMSKISLLLYFTAFTMYVYLWAKVMPFVSVKTLTVAFVVVNILLWVVCIVLETVAILQSSGGLPTPTGTAVSLECGNPVYNSIICLLAIAQLIIATMFCVYGCRLMAVLRKAAVSSRRDTVSRKKVERRVLGVSIPSSALFLLRSVLFLYCPIATHIVPHGEILYPWFFYLVPDLVPATLIFVMTIPASGPSRRRKQVQYETL